MMRKIESTPVNVLVLCGPTGSGKTSFAVTLAEHFPLEVISADSRQVYRRMDIGTAKATAWERAKLPHHMIDLIDPDEEFSVADFVDAARPLISAIAQRGKIPCVVGGTGLYIRALLGGLAKLPAGNERLRAELHRREAELGSGTLFRDLQRVDPVSAARIHPNNLVRIVRALEVYELCGKRMSDLQAEHEFSDRPFRTLKLAMEIPRAELFARIDHRAEHMLHEGLVAEVEALARDYSPRLKALQTLGYREVLRYLEGAVDQVQMLEEIRRHTRQYAKRQLTWFKNEREIIWVDSSNNSGRVVQSIDNFILGQRSGHAQITI